MQDSVAQFLQGMFEKISAELLQQGDLYLSFQFYILSGRFSIQTILDTYLERFLELASTTDVKGLGAILTACVHKVVEQGTYTADVTFLFCAYTFMRGCQLVPASLDFESFVDLMHGKKFKVVRPGNTSGLDEQGRPVATSVTPEVFILQVDLLTSCMGAENHDQARSEDAEETKESQGQKPPSGIRH
mmetsp:Transcript_33628/g.44405  ORF Transcript_33628/g.44405 Transcript_33628/m.44405 type:complete len:188 (-) Transcript_33628:80-643(-)